MSDFGSLWVGRPLSKIEITCLSSFVKHGHNFTLFVYDKKLKVPNGIIKKDANRIIPKQQIFKTDNSYGPFADMFRYQMIKKTGLIWTDTDNICLKKKWNFPEYCFGLQGGGHGLVANGILKAPQNSKIINDLVRESSNFNKKDIKWGEIGPQLLTAKIKEHDLEKYIQQPKVFYPVNYWEWEDLFMPDKASSVISKSLESHTIQIWHQMLNRVGYDNNNFPEGSAMDYFYKKYVRKNENKLIKRPRFLY